MKAVMNPVSEHLLEWRRRTGSNHWDEMWDGVLHMGSMPNRQQQDLEGSLETWLRVNWARRLGGRVYHQICVAAPGRWPVEYRIPDLVLLNPDRFDIDRNEYFDGSPSAVVEIRCPDDETYDKFDFYTKLGVPEIWVIHRDTREPEIHVLDIGEYHPVPPDAQGWLRSPGTQVELRPAPGARLEVRVGNDDGNVDVLPDEP